MCTSIVNRKLGYATVVAHEASLGRWEPAIDQSLFDVVDFEILIKFCRQ